MNESCSPELSLCYDGRGLCTEGFCMCKNGFVNSGDLSKFTKCSTHVVTGKVLNLFCSTTYLISLVIGIWALIKLRRSNRSETITEAAVLTSMIISSCLYVFLGIWIATAEPYGSRAIGVDLVSSLCFGISQWLLWTFILSKPLIVIRTSVSTSAFTYAPRVKRLYLTTMPFLYLFSVTAGFFSIGTVYSPPEVTLFSAIFCLMYSITPITLTLIINFSLLLIRRKVRLALALKLPEAHRIALNKYSKRVHVASLLSFLTILPLTAWFIICAADPEVLRTTGWYFLPTGNTLISVWIFRHVVNSLRYSLLAPDTSQKPETSPDSGDRLPEPVEIRPSSQNPNSKMAQISSRNPLFRNLKTKMLEYLSVVAEETQEDSVVPSVVDHPGRKSMV